MTATTLMTNNGVDYIDKIMLWVFLNDLVRLISSKEFQKWFIFSIVISIYTPISLNH